MSVATQGGLSVVDVNGTEIELMEAGKGPCIVYLGSCHWIADDTNFQTALEQHAHVITPRFPGIGAAKDKNNLNSVDDLAYLYLDLIEKRGLSDVTLVGASFGGWVAAEMAVRRSPALKKLVLINPLGIKLSERTTRDITDFFGTPDADLRRRAFMNPDAAGPQLRDLEDGALRARLQARETLTRFGWSPYMHHPRLKQRLARIQLPTLVLGGAQDEITSPGYARSYASLVPGARFDEINNARHFAHIEQASAVAERVTAFAR